jgi:hypothetical protein
MKTGLFFTGIMIASLSMGAVEANPTMKNGHENYVAAKAPSLSIDPKLRALDYRQVFDTLRKEKPANKVCIHLMNGNTISNIIDMQLMSSNTMFLLRYNTPQGIKLQAIELECIESVGYLE